VCFVGIPALKGETTKLVSKKQSSQSHASNATHQSTNEKNHAKIENSSLCFLRNYSYRRNIGSFGFSKPAGQARI
jgi:hypothetical protein